eukprot:3827410-Rhodomonas_salina.1
MACFKHNTAAAVKQLRRFYPCRVFLELYFLCIHVTSVPSEQVAPRELTEKLVQAAQAMGADVIIGANASDRRAVRLSPDRAHVGRNGRRDGIRQQQRG